MQAHHASTETAHGQPGHVRDDHPTYSGETEAEISEADLAELFSIPPVPPPGYTPRTLTYPVALPRVSASYDSPFARAYAPDLAQLGVSQDVWLHFLDGLSLAMIASPPLQVLGRVGMGVALSSPSLAVKGVGITLQVIARTGQHYLSKSGTEKYLLRANREFFGLRGLRARLMKGDALKVFVGAKGEKAHESTREKMGNVAERLFTKAKLPVVTPVSSMILNTLKPLPKDGHTQTGAATSGPSAPKDEFVTRRMAGVHGYIANVTFDVPPPTTPEGILQKWSASSVKSNIKESERNQHADDRARSLRDIGPGESQISAAEYREMHQDGYGTGMRGRGAARRAGRQAGFQERRAGRGRGGHGPGQRKGDMAERRENQDEDSLIWLVVYPAARDIEIEGVQQLDSDRPLELSAAEYERLQTEANAEEYDDSDDEPEAHYSTAPAYRA